MNRHLELAKTNGLGAHILNLLNQTFTPRKDIYDFTHQESGINYFFNAVHQGQEAYLTGQGRKIRPGVYILLSVDEVLQTYRVKDVSFYASPEDLWTAHLVKVSREAMLS
jgi:hypothetical protein